ncbi:MAG TPA: L-histidine N(alpha)-methyltransferase [Chthoniobacterales bacterium]|jgi:dimethylhistidine N-methyltransferase
MNHESGQAAVLDLEPGRSEFLQEVLAGLSSLPRTLPCKFFYDEAGAALFQRICELPEYYITRTELQILQTHGPEMAAHLGAGIALIGLGTGAGTKTRILLEQLRDPAVYVPVDISSGQLAQSTALFRQLFPSLEVLAVCADYLQPFPLPAAMRRATRRVVYFPGSTIGNFEPDLARDFLRRVALLSQAGGGLLIGVDLQKNHGVLERAYNDSQGVTAEFNLNLLARINRELHADFNLPAWQHRAIYNSAAGRIEMNLISARDQSVRLGERRFTFEAGERIITEFSCKYTPDGFAQLAQAAGFKLDKVWTDAESLFGVFYFTLPA